MSTKNTETASLASVGVPRLVRPFEVGQWVDYRNHVVGYRVCKLEVVDITETIITAESEEGQKFTFREDTGVATWSGNLSITHWPNTEGLASPAGADNPKL